MKNPKVSVLMPVYNEEKYIETAIKSVLNQTYKNFELIIIDDKSTDDTGKIAKNYEKKDDRINVVKLKKKGYRAGALNRGLKIAKGKYIAFIDGDDLYKRKKLEKQVNFLESEKSVDLTYTSMLAFYPNGQKKKLPAKRFPKNPLESIKEAQNKDLKNIPPHRILYFNNKKILITGASVMARKKIFKDNIKFDNKLKAAQDYDLWFKMIGKGINFAPMKEILYLYRNHKNQISKDNKKLTKSIKRIHQKLKKGKYLK